MVIHFCDHVWVYFILFLRFTSSKEKLHWIRQHKTITRKNFISDWNRQCETNS